MLLLHLIYSYNFIAPYDGYKENHRLKEGMKHLAANIEGPKLLQKVEFALSFVVHSLSVEFLVQSVIKMNIQVSVFLHHPPPFSAWMETYCWPT